MLQIKKKIRSIDGFFKNYLNISQIADVKKINKKNLSIVGKGNSISGIPYNKKSILIKLIFNKEFKFCKKKKEIRVSGNCEVYKVHNYLNKKKFFFPSFPSYTNVTLGACIANCVHGNNPKDGTIKKFITEIKLYNPNFGIKILSPKINKKLFDLTIGGMGMTGIILSARLKVLKLSSNYIKIEKNIKFYDLFMMYNYLRFSKYIYNQNNIFINYSKKNFIVGRVSSGNFYKKKFFFKPIIQKKILNFRINVFGVKIFKRLIEIIFLNKKFFLKKKIYINEAFYPSNNKLLYFNLISNKFIEHQIIIPHKFVKKFLIDFENLVKLFSPLITLCHFKIFNGKSKYFQFDGKGLGFSIHISINKNFNKFYKEFLILNKKNRCILNLYKNSYINSKIIKNNYKLKFKKFKKEIKKINKKYIFCNNIFNQNNFYR